MRIVPLIVCLLLCWNGLIGQSYYFGPKGGSSIGFQRWENFQQSPLFSWHGAFFLESYSEDNQLNSLYAQIGWHNRGSAYRNLRQITIDGDLINVPTKNFVFSNAVLGVGGKRKQPINKQLQSYYCIGLRLEYTVLTNLDEYDTYNSYFNYPFYPDNQFVRHLNYGVTVGGGFEYVFSEMTQGVVEFTINPDLSRQYEQFPLNNIPDPYNPGKLISIRERRIKNISLEISFALKFLRKVIYVDY